MKTIKQLRRAEGRYFVAGIILMIFGLGMVHFGLALAAIGAMFLRISWETCEQADALAKKAGS